MRWLVLLAVIAAATACTETDLYRDETKPPVIFDNKVKLSGRFCTTDPADVVFPLKVLFIIDTSQSMGGQYGNDPISQTEPDPLRQCGRVNAIREVVEQYINIKSAFTPVYCNTGVSGCAKGSTSCPDCGQNQMCVGPDCCLGTQDTCKGVPACLPTTGPDKGYNGSCIPLCDVNKPGCRESENNCPDCPDPGDRCLGGICGNHKDPGVEFAISRFGSAKQVLTRNTEGLEGFTNDVVELIGAMPQVCNNGSVTDYEGAFSMAYKVISDDIKRMIETNASAVNRTKYVVVFLSDGAPYPRINDEDDWETVPDYVTDDMLGPNMTTEAIQEYNIPGRILQRVKEVLSLKTLYGVGDINVHTAYLADNTSPSWVEDEATYLLKQMAQLGKGTFRSFPNNEAINFLHVGFSSLKRVFRMKNFMVTNLSAYPTAGEQLKDSDGDGLQDQVETLAGTDLVRTDSDHDGFSDLLEHFYRGSGWDALDPSDADCPLLKDADGDKLPDDSDGDGLLDCEERFLGTSRNRFDTDADGIPDGVEVRFGTNPVVVDTADDQLDFDGMPNGDEIRLHTDPRSDDAAHRSRISYRYHVQKVGSGVEVVGMTCGADSNCPAGHSCIERYCRCDQDDMCNTLTACENDGQCTFAGEQCVSGQCRGGWTCRAADTINLREPLAQTDKVCGREKNISCYDFDVENIALVTPKATPITKEKGWNDLMLYFGEVPFDNPGDYGNFKVACVKAWYNDENGSKLPAIGRLSVPQSAWHDPTELYKTYAAAAKDNSDGSLAECGADPASQAALYCNPGDSCVDNERRRCRVATCVCPDGTIGNCK